MRRGSISGVIVLIWLVIGLVAAVQRGYFERDDTNCAHAGSTIVTVLAGPLNYIGVNPQVDCDLPEPSE